MHNDHGVFHPKVSAFLGKDDAHVLIGSGNLTFGGWGGNLEVAEHFHAGSRPSVLRDLAEYFELLAVSDQIKVGAPEKLLEFASELRLAVGQKTDDGNVRLIHNEAQAIADRVREEAYNLGGAERICFVSPFYDLKGGGVSKLARDLECDDIWGYVHPSGEVQGTRSSNWPHDAGSLLKPGQVEWQLVDDHRRLHAKLIEVKCRRGRLLVSGSANATGSGLYGPNAEVCVLRINQDEANGWKIIPGSPPPQVFPDEEHGLDEENEKSVSVLTAELQGAVVSGSILGRWVPSSGLLTCNVSGDEFSLGQVDIDPDGNFAAHGTALPALL